MSLTREDMLRELELLPVWRLNAPLAQPQPFVVPPVLSAEPLVAEPIDTPPVIVEALVSEVMVEPVLAPIAREEVLVPDLVDDVAHMDWATLNQHVLGAGDQNADWLFVGDVPSPDEKQAGLPFTGDAGVLFDKMLIAIQLQRSKNVYLTHLSDLPYLHRQIALIQPKLIFVFGEIVAQALLNTSASLDESRGKVHQYQDVALIASYAPSHLIQHPQDKAKAWADLCLARDTMQSLKS